MRALVSLIASLLVLVAALTVTTATARAADPAASAQANERARMHFQNGVRLYDQKPADYEGALAEFRAAYAEKASPSIKQNIALCLRALRRYGEAIEALEQMIAEGGDSIAPETRARARKAIEEMSALVASVRLRVVLHVGPGAPAAPPTVEVAIDGFQVPPEKLTKPMRLGPGEHTFTAHARGYGDALKRMTLVAGQREVPLDLDLFPAGPGATTGRLHVTATLRAATIAIDGVPLAQGEWTGDVPPGTHHVEVTHPGIVAYGQDVVVAAGTVMEVQANMGEALPGDAPPAWSDGDQKRPAAPAVERYWAILFGADIGTGSRTQTLAMNEGLESRRSYTGGGVIVKGTRRFGQHLVLELWGEIGALSVPSYRLAVKPAGEAATNAQLGTSRVSATYGAIGPELRLRSAGKSVRAIGGMGFGARFETVSLQLPSGSTRKADGWEGVVLWEAGMQISVSRRVLLELGGYAAVHGVGSIEHDASTFGRYYADSPAVRGGVRILMGFMF